MLYEINRQKDYNYINCYFYKSKNECGQLLKCEFYQLANELNAFNFMFYIKQKRKHSVLEGKAIGKDGLKSLI